MGICVEYSLSLSLAPWALRRGHSVQFFDLMIIIFCVCVFLSTRLECGKCKSGTKRLNLNKFCKRDYGEWMISMLPTTYFPTHFSKSNNKWTIQSVKKKKGKCTKIENFLFQFNLFCFVFFSFLPFDLKLFVIHLTTKKKNQLMKLQQSWVVLLNESQAATPRTHHINRPSLIFKFKPFSRSHKIRPQQLYERAYH